MTILNEPTFRCPTCRDTGFVLREGVYRDTAFSTLDEAIHTPATYSARCNGPDNRGCPFRASLST